MKNTEQTTEKTSIFASRKFRFGSFATAFTALFILVVILFNVMITALDKAVDLTLDVTGEGMFKISDTSKEYLDSLQTPVTITVLADEDAVKQQSK